MFWNPKGKKTPKKIKIILNFEKNIKKHYHCPFYDTYIVLYFKYRDRSSHIQKHKKGDETMSGNIRRNENETMDMRLIPETCNCSGYTMAMVAGGLLLCLGIILYALLV